MYSDNMRGCDVARQCRLVVGEASDEQVLEHVAETEVDEEELLEVRKPHLRRACVGERRKREPV
jgi:hypothetical protein